MNHRFTLEPYSGLKSRFRCPNCGKNNCFSLYVDIQKNKYIDISVGRCNREIKCGYHYTPKQYFEDHQDQKPKTAPIKRTPSKQLVPNKIGYIDPYILKRSITSKHSNYFLSYLSTIFDAVTVQKLQSKYHIGTSKKWNGATVFWQVDFTGKIRSGKIMLYNRVTGKRIKKPYNHISWIHKALHKHDYFLKQCFYGEHLIKTSTNPIAIVESEKTAIIASVFLPEFTWLASGSLSNLTYEKTKVLKGLQVILFPDLNAYDKWKEKIASLHPETTYQISDLLERKATIEQRKNGLDIADYLVALDMEKYLRE